MDAAEGGAAMTMEFYMALGIGLVAGYCLGTVITSLLWIARQSDGADDSAICRPEVHR